MKKELLVPCLDLCKLHLNNRVKPWCTDRVNVKHSCPLQFGDKTKQKNYSINSLFEHLEQLVLVFESKPSLL